MFAKLQRVGVLSVHEAIGFRVCAEATNGAEAIQAATDHKPGLIVNVELNASLNCHLKSDDLEILTKEVMEKMYPGGKPRRKK